MAYGKFTTYIQQQRGSRLKKSIEDVATGGSLLFSSVQTHCQWYVRFAWKGTGAEKAEKAVYFDHIFSPEVAWISYVQRTRLFEAITTKVCGRSVSL